MSTTCQIKIPPSASLDPPTLSPAEKVQDHLSIGYLRTFATLLVLAHHAVLAYVTIAPPPAHSLLTQPRWWAAFPVVDPHKSSLFDLLVGFNDTFFMSLMFLVSGLFVWNSLQRKGAGKFANGRALRLGIPFVVAAAIIPLIAYYPAYLQTGATSGIRGFLEQWLHLGGWPAGPAWFIWVLLLFDCLVAAFFSKSSARLPFLGKLSYGSAEHPGRFFWLLVSVSAAAYIPLAVNVGPLAWTQFGPFSFQTSRLLHYFVYFLAGVSLGMFGLNRGLFSSEGKLARQWLRWCLLSLVVFVAAVAFSIGTARYASSALVAVFTSFGFVVSCAANCFALSAIFLRFSKTRHKIFDSLRNNAYGMYLIHYAFVSWLQYLLLPTAVPALFRGLLVFVGTAALSWASISLLRRQRYFARVL